MFVIIGNNRKKWEIETFLNRKKTHNLYSPANAIKQITRFEITLCMIDEIEHCSFIAIRIILLKSELA